ncbi:fungal-specific transcription factor domain-containing protein [Xylaria cf. heliscus]|nr:fungal-specific transcription factor domain-containing protein [Xylaria cf. heliscus]
MRTRKGRPEPVSCQLCRSKKLRCNRAQPCSNCESRNVSCHFLIPPPRSQRDGTSEAHQDTEIIARLKRLESIVLLGGTPGEKRLDSQISFASHSEDTSRYRDLYLLENIGVREDSLISTLSNELSFTIRSVDNIVESLGNPQHVLLPYDQHSGKLIVTFPTYNTAAILFDCFEANVDHMCHILNLPLVRSHMKFFYAQINQKESVLPGHAALLLSLFALSVFFYQPTDSAEVLAIGNDKTRLSKYWSRGALDVLEHSRRSTSGTLEDVQALILMSYVTYHLDGFSARYRHLLAIAVSMAQDLGLHRLDSNDYTLTSHTSLRVLIDHEVKRRVYWHLISSDWTQSTMSGPQEGTYSIHPNHVQVKLPKDYDVEDVIAGDGDESIARARPTGITFLLARIRLAHLSREYTDTIPLETSMLMQVPYEYIITFDQKLKDFLMELPYFFRLDQESRQKSKRLEAVYTKIPMMRYCILAAAHTRRCRLHQKFLIRMSSDSRYDYSRQACLESARAVIQLYEEAEGESPLETARMAMVVHYTHLALVIQVLDLCFNKTETDHDERKREVLITLQMLESARNVSPLLNRSLNSVIEVLRKHEVWLAGEGLTSGSFQSSGQQSLDANTYPFGSATVTPPQHNLETGEGASTIAPINEFWQSANQFEMEFDSAIWDNLFSALDSRPF